MMKMVDSLVASLTRFGIGWPSTCILCSAPGVTAALDLCEACRADLPHTEIACVRCGEPLLSQRGGERGWLCGACLRRPPRSDVAFCALRYAYPLDSMIQQLKYGGAIAQGRVLGELLAAHLERVHRGPWPAVMIPVPLAQGRFEHRGYNQAIEIGAIVSRRLQLPLNAALVVRSRETPEQAGLKRQQRQRNVRGAFTLIDRLPAKHVAIVDDVVTTGSTVNELARVLKRAGARRVEVWAVARAAKPR